MGSSRIWSRRNFPIRFTIRRRRRFSRRKQQQQQQQHRRCLPSRMDRTQRSGNSVSKWVGGGRSGRESRTLDTRFCWWSRTSAVHRQSDRRRQCWRNRDSSRGFRVWPSDWATAKGNPYPSWQITTNSKASLLGSRQTNTQKILVKYNNDWLLCTVTFRLKERVGVRFRVRGSVGNRSR